MPDYDIWSPDRHKIGYIANANNESEALGRSRERWKLPNDLSLVAMLRVPSDKTAAMINVGDLIHTAATATYQAWQSAFLAGDHEAAARLERAYKNIAKAYTYMMQVADIVDADAQAQARLAAEVQTYNTYSDPAARPNLADNDTSD